MGALGFFGCLIPEEYGANGLGFLAHALISEEIARIHSAIRGLSQYAGGSRRNAL
jgi:glutaryl-CoA dehydrogenase (non-decarboxylating)